MSFPERPVTFLTDFGYSDEFAGVVRAVIARVNPELTVIDLTHGIDPGDVRRGALSLAASVPFASPSVHLAVVDPGVGTARRAVAVAAGEHFLVGPDNGLLWLAAERLGGIDEAVEISESPYRLIPTHRTFHGRDIFGPVAAHLASGVPLSELGEPIAVGSLTPIDLPRPRLEGDLLVGHVLGADRYGNLSLNIDGDLVERSFLTSGRPVAAETGGPVVTEIVFGKTFGDVDPGEAVLLPDSSGSLALAVNQGDAASRFGLGPDDEIALTPLG
jgi:S-adenosyl-L-methionine hydrolase (adenosine-forming)